MPKKTTEKPRPDAKPKAPVAPVSMPASEFNGVMRQIFEVPAADHREVGKANRVKG